MRTSALLALLATLAVAAPLESAQSQTGFLPSATLQAKLKAEGPDLATADAAGRYRVIVTYRSNGPLGLQGLAAANAAADPETRQRLIGAVLGIGPASEPARRIRRYGSMPLVALDASVADMESLAADPAVQSIQIDRKLKPLLDRTTVQIGARAIWPQGGDGRGHAVAVLDTGVRTTHPFFRSRIIDQACFSGGGSTLYSLCPNGQPTQTGPGAAESCLDTLNGDCFHGSHVAGIVLGSNGRKMSRAGVAPAARLIAVQVFTEDEPRLTAWGSDILAGLDYVNTQHLANAYGTVKVAAVNMSLGGGAYPAACDAQDPAMALAIATLRGNGILTVIASGNDGLVGAISYPACMSEALTVAAVDKTDKFAPYANVNAVVDLYAPGTDIYSALNAGFGKATGTSMAAPHVAGAVAALRGAMPTATPNQIEAALKATGRPISQADVVRQRIRVDYALAWMKAAASPPAPTPPGTNPTLAVSPLDGWTVTREKTGDYSRTSKNYDLIGTNGGVVYRITAGASGIPSWLKVSTTYSDTVTKPSVTLSINETVAAKLPNGTHRAVLTFTNSTNNLGTTSRTVTFVRK